MNDGPKSLEMSWAVSPIPNVELRCGFGGEAYRDGVIRHVGGKGCEVVPRTNGCIFDLQIAETWSRYILDGAGTDVRSIQRVS